MSVTNFKKPVQTQAGGGRLGEQEAPTVPVEPTLGNPNAPTIYCDLAAAFGANVGIVSVTLVAFQFHPTDRDVRTDRVVAGHLRMPIPAARSLRDALNNALLLAEPVTSAKN